MTEEDDRSLFCVGPPIWLTVIVLAFVVAVGTLVTHKMEKLPANETINATTQHAFEASPHLAHIPFILIGVGALIFGVYFLLIEV